MSVAEKLKAIIAIIEQYQLESVIQTETSDFSASTIHLSDVAEMRKFGSSVKIINRNSIDYPTELAVEIDGIRVFALVHFKENAGAA
ncbi:hypothetical protein MKX47_21210 [Solibacillus sp. FSL R7-0668]|uniref:hypothetical protein n=1 Tax=Solibacillus sp. FSL R7-0668 TaxID=2921688 RepID=UPI0030FCAD95